MPQANEAIDRPEEYHEAARAYCEGNLIAAQRLCQAALASVPDFCDALYLMGIIAFDKGDDDAAVDFFRRAIGAGSSPARSYLYLGATYQRIEDFSAALAATRRALKSAPDWVDAHLQLGLIYQLRGDFSDAVAAYRAGLDIDVQRAALHNNLGNTLHEQGQQSGATECYLRAVALEPDRVEYLYNLAFNLEYRCLLDDAIDRYREAAQLDPHSVTALLALARIHSERDENQLAVDAFQAVIRRDPCCREAHLGLAGILVDAEKLESARVCFENLLRLDAEDVDANLGLADIFRELGLTGEAIDRYRIAQDLGSTVAGHFLAALTHGKSSSAPRQYVVELFDDYSDHFDEHLTGALGYQAPKLLFESFNRKVGHVNRFRRALDLGCGTGLAGQEFESIVDRIDGVDLSVDMLEKARRKGIYGELEAADIVAFMNGCTHTYDLFIATDVFIYVGELEALFIGVARRSTPGAYLVFTTESADCEGFELRSSGRYAHSEAYIRTLAKAQNFGVVHCSDIPLRKEGENWIEGQLYILKLLRAN